ncbi:hypothetical protein [Microvirga splendida]|uniref:Uncharacterized protein n=1 Tax=Microvirga splendida TaxID=2795727 RepID=A0ABS0Y2B3_9HYPH|nr:hypothetical protein [Microvirga splendida]MBJ6126443.1 hypothetical protein [Microvirga splendida]
MPDVLWVAAGLLLALPADMKPAAVAVERIAVSGLQPPALGHTDQLFCSWSNGGGASIALHWWNAPNPPRDLGPLSTAESWDTSIDGHSVSAARTDMFMGRKEEVLVAWPSLAGLKASAMLHARGLSREQFDHMLKQGRIVEDRQPWSMTCEPAPQGSR